MSDDAIKPEDRSLFRQAMKDVDPISAPEPANPGKKPAPRPSQGRADDRQVMRDLAESEWDPADLETGEELLFARPGIRSQTMRKLRRGLFSVRDELDLHHMNEAAARLSLGEFLAYHHKRGSDCVKVIHGKGLRSKERGPVLKRLVNGMLRRRSEVLAFASARPSDGGTGAVYVLLKRPRPQPG